MGSASWYFPNDSSSPSNPSYSTFFLSPDGRHQIVDGIPLAPQLSKLLAWVGEHKIWIEITLVTIFYAPFVLSSSWNVTQSWYSRFLRQPYYTLIVHNFASILELVHYYSRLAALGHPPTPTRFESVLAAVQLATSLVLCAHVKKNRSETRATLHIMAAHRLWAAAMAAYFNDAAWNRASIKLLDNFVWLRYYTVLGKGLAGMGTYLDRYRAGTALTHTFLLWLVDYPYGIPTYVAGYLALLAVNSYVTERMRIEKAGVILRIVDYLGFGSHPGDLDKQDDDDKKVEDEVEAHEVEKAPKV
jgi:hypothetical protein